MIQNNTDTAPEDFQDTGSSVQDRRTKANELYRIASADAVALDRRKAKSDRRSSDDQRSCFRFAADQDQESYIIVREQHNSVNEKTGEESSVIVDVPYDVIVKDHSSGGFGILINTAIPLEIDHVIRLSQMGRIHLIQVRNIRETDTEGFQLIGAEYIEDVVEETPELSILELFVDRRHTVGRLKGTIAVVSAVILAWLGVLAYAISLKMSQ